MKRQGWAAAVGQVYLTRDGREVRITHYSVDFVGTHNEAELLGEVRDIPQPTVEIGIAPELASLLEEANRALDRQTFRIEFDENGNYRRGGPQDTDRSHWAQPQHPLDLIEAKLPAGAPVAVRSALEVKDDAKGEPHGN